MTHRIVFVCLAVLALPAAAAVRICHSINSDVMADNTGATPAATAFNTCIADPLVTSIDLPPGTYLIEHQVIVKAMTGRTSFTIRTAGLAGNTKNCEQLGAAACATLFASAEPTACINQKSCGNVPADGGGFLQSIGAKHVIFDHLILDGNARNRTYLPEMLKHCKGGNGIKNEQFWGFNSRMVGCFASPNGDRCEFTYNFTHDAVCSASLQFEGSYGRVQGNAVFANGIHQRYLWADGISIPANDNGIVNDNHLVDNTDVALIIGSGVNTHIQSNWIQQRQRYVFAALMLGNFREGGDTTRSGNYNGAMIDHNTIQCANLCAFGINFGPDPWLATAQDNVFGGMVNANSIDGAKVAINFGGANNINVTNNTLTHAPLNATNLGSNGQSPCATNAGALVNLPNSGICINSINYPGANEALCFMDCWKNEPVP
ncbi:MAG TPA: hypothetical protein VJ901_20890 [Thermoanaerobaculia bacterium]|nr:hypothetical protein [Thermoanaerobaculia bacterium]